MLEQAVKDFVQIIIRVPIVPPLIFFAFSVLGKVIVRAESLKNPSTRKGAWYIILSNGSSLTLVALAVVFAAAMAETVNADYSKAVNLLILSIIFLVLYFLVCAVESWFNDLTDPWLMRIKRGWLGLHIPTASGCIMIWVGVVAIGG